MDRSCLNSCKECLDWIKLRINARWSLQMSPKMLQFAGRGKSRTKMNNDSSSVCMVTLNKSSVAQMNYVLQIGRRVHVHVSSA